MNTVSIDECSDLRDRVKVLRRRCRNRVLTKNQRKLIILCIKYVASEVRCGGGMSNTDQEDLRKIFHKMEAWK